MDSQIETWRVQAYAANVYQLSQQRGSRLAGIVRKEAFTGKAEFFDRLGLATAQDKTLRNEDTPNLNIDHSRRMVTTVTRHWGTIVDRKDKLQNIHNPENEYSVAAQNALGRKMDEIIIKAAMNAAASGEDGTSSVELGNAQKVAAVASAAIDFPNVQLLRKAKYILDSAEAVGTRYIVCGSEFIDALLGNTLVTSADYNSVKTLVSGEVDTFMGFKFIRSEVVAGLLAEDYDANTFKYSTATGLYSASGTAVASTDKVALAFVGDGLILGENTGGRVARIGEREDKSYGMQVYAAMDFGAVRMEEAKVVQMIYKA